MNKTHKVVMLPTKKSNNVGDIVMRPSDRRLATINVLTVDDPQEAINQHLYIISDDEIKEGDWAIHPSKGVYQAIRDLDELSGSKKIIASTDASLFMYLEKFPGRYPLPLIHESFIKIYVNKHNEGISINEVKPITEVDVEYEWKRNSDDAYTGTEVKLRSDNTIIIHQSKKYSRDEVVRLIGDYISSDNLSNLGHGHLSKWLEDNL